MSEDISFDDQLALERTGANAGLNPMFGEWRHRFEFPPVPYGNGAAQRGAFRIAIQAEMTNQWLYSHEIHLDITLHVDVQTTLETDETADLDNYAKAILDGLKGPNGIMIDDTQVQALSIHWIDGYGPPSFTVETKGSPDDFVLKPQEFYEMPDGLWYPHGRRLWSEGGVDPTSDVNHYAGLSIIELMSSTKSRVRAELRRGGADRLRAYQQSRYVTSLARGFHRSRIDDGFPLHARRAWQADRKRWQAKNGGAFAKVEAQVAELAIIHDKFIALLASMG